jgi:hypothetical protein
VVVAAVAAAVETGTKPEQVFYTSGLPSGSPAFSFLELPINSMRSRPL